MAVVGYQIRLKVVFNANGGSGAPDWISNPINGYEVVPEIPYTLSVILPASKPTRYGYTFLGWSVSSGATSASYQAGGQYSFTFYDVLYGEPTEHVTTLYAVWQHITDYVYYNANGTGVSNLPSTQSHWRGYSITLSNKTPDRDGYTFIGWATSASATTAQYLPGGTYSFANTVTLYAVWESIVTYVAYIKVNGVWKQADVYVRVGGQWKKATNAYVKVGGAWKST